MRRPVRAALKVANDRFDEMAAMGEKFAVTVAFLALSELWTCWWRCA
jgi:hypothetical protein